MAGESVPILLGAIPVFEMIMTKWEKISANHPHLMPFIKPGLDWAYRYYGHMDHTHAYVIAMHKQLYLSNRTANDCILNMS